MEDDGAVYPLAVDPTFTLQYSQQQQLIGSDTTLSDSFGYAWNVFTLAESRGAFDDVRLRQRPAEAYIEVKLFRLNNLRTLSRLANGARARARRQRPEALLERDDQAAPRHGAGGAGRGRAALEGCHPTIPGDGKWQRSWLYYQASSIFAGTNEVQRTLLGERVLGLPGTDRRRPGPHSRGRDGRQGEGGRCGPWL